MPHQVTATGNAGPGRAAVATVLPNVTDVNFAFNDRRVQVFFDNAPNFSSEFELTPATTVTITNANGNFSVVIA